MIGEAQLAATTRVLTSALFVDFDNMYAGLKRHAPGYAEDFAEDPGRLVDWLREGRDERGPFRRRFLLMSCYLNPGHFGGFRGAFAAAGFRVVDCPSLTRHDKSSADIHLVLDAVDALGHPTRFDEFVVASADADFSPLMARVRAHDRRTTILATGPFASVYDALCDETIDSAALLAGWGARTTGTTGRARPAGTATDPLPTEQLPKKAAAAPTARTTTAAPRTAEPAAKKTAAKKASAKRTSASKTPAKTTGITTGSPDATTPHARPQHGKAPVVSAAAAARAAKAVRAALAASTDPVPGSVAAHVAITAAPGIAEGWAGTGGFSRFVELHLPDVVEVKDGPGHLLMHPGRHRRPDATTRS